MTDRAALVAQLIEHEGLKLTAYMDTVGKITIGVGRNLSDVGISEAEALTLLDHDIDAVLADLDSFAWFSELDAVRQRVLADMAFNLGATRFRGFKSMLAAVEAGEYGRAAKAMLNSLWAQQTGQRAVRLTQMMRTGDDITT